MALDTLEVFGDEYVGVAGFKAKDDNGNTKIYIRPQGTKSISSNGSGIDVTEYASVNVSVSPDLESKSVSITPSESSQTQTVSPGAGKDGLSSVSISVSAIPSTYVGTGITRRDSTDLSASGATVSVPKGYYEDNETISIASGTEGTPVATKGAVNNHSISITPSVTNTGGYISGGSHTGTAVSVSASELVSGNLPISSNGNNIDVTNYATVSVSVSPTLRSVTKTYTPSESSQSETISPGTGYDGLSSVSITVDPISSTYVGSGITRRDSTDLTASGATVSVPSGYYANPASKAVASGTEGTPIATKGTVNNHSITVTPSVTNNAGYISGGSHSGTGVTVTASELVSGSETKTTNGTYDVTNLQTLIVNVNTGSSKNIQAYFGRAQRTANSYGATDLTLTVAKTGTYNVYWTAWRSSSSGTMGTNLHRNNSSGTNQQTFTGTYGQNITLTNQSYTQGDVLTLYATSGSTSRSIYVANLIIEEV